MKTSPLQMNASPRQLRRGTASDLDAIVALERATDSAPHWPQATYAAVLSQEVADSQRCLIVAHDPSVHNDSLAGFAVGLMHRIPRDAASWGTNYSDDNSDDQVAELESVVVAASARRAGIGRALCRGVIDWCGSHGATEVVLEVRAASAGAIALYAGLGFTQVGHRPRYYREPDDDAIIMRLRLDRSSSEGI